MQIRSLGSRCGKLDLDPIKFNTAYETINTLSNWVSVIHWFKSQVKTFSNPFIRLTTQN